MQQTRLASQWLRGLSAGGLQARFASLTALGLASHLSLEFSFNFLPVAFSFLIPALGLSYGQVGTIVLVMSLTGTLAQPLFGLLVDRRDPRRIVVLSLIWGGALMGLVGFAPSYALLLGLVAVAALGSAAFHPAGAALTAADRTQGRGWSMSLFSVGGNLGAALSPLIVGVVLVWVGLPGTVVVIPVALLTAVWLHRQYGRYGMLKINEPRVHDAPGGATAAGAGSMAALLAMVLVVAARSWFQQALMTYLPEWLLSDGATAASAGAALTILMIAVSAGSLFGGPLSDRFGRLRVIFASLALLVAGQWLLLHLDGAGRAAAVILIGVMIGASFPVTIVLAQEAWPGSVGFASAMVMGLGWLPAGLGAWTVGQIADRSSLTAGLESLLFAPLVGLAAAVFYALYSRRRRARQNA